MSAAIDITTDSLRNKGFTVKKEHGHMVIQHKDLAPWISPFYKKDWSKTTNKLEKELQSKGVDQLIISEIDSCMAGNYSKLMNGAAATKRDEILLTESQRQNRPTMSPKAVRVNCSMEEWRTQLKSKYNNLKTLTEINAPGLWTPLEFVISIKCILNIADITLPVIGIILGPPSSWKTVAVNMPKGARDTFGVDSFSPKSFVSHNSNLTEEQLREIDLLPKIKNKLFMVPELSPLFTSREEDLENIIGMIVRLGDGEGYTSASGSKGPRGYEGPIMFCWVGAAVSIPYKIHKQLSRLGPKLYFLRLPMTTEDEDELLKMLEDNNYNERIGAIKKALFDYLEYLESCPNMEIDPASGIPKLDWNSKNADEKDAKRRIIYLAELLAHLRGTVETWETQDSQGLDYAYGSETIENVKRVTTQLYNLARAHALSQGRDYITIKDDLPLITKVVLSGAASVERVKVLDLLLLSGDRYKRYSAEEVADAIGTSVKTAKRTMVEFKALKLVDFDELGSVGEPLTSIRLKDGFDWFFTQEFKDLKADYMTGDFKDQLVRKKGQQQQ